VIKNIINIEVSGLERTPNVLRSKIWLPQSFAEHCQAFVVIDEAAFPRNWLLAEKLTNSYH